MAGKNGYLMVKIGRLWGGGRVIPGILGPSPIHRKYQKKGFKLSIFVPIRTSCWPAIKPQGSLANPPVPYGPPCFLEAKKRQPIQGGIGAKECWMRKMDGKKANRKI